MVGWSPVMYAAAGLERKTTAMAMSHLRPTRFSGMVSFIMASRCSAVPGSSFARPATKAKRRLTLLSGLSPLQGLGTAQLPHGCQ